jgi:ferrochelatase
MQNKPKKTAVVLMNLGGPSDLSSVKPFLINLFSDPLIIRTNSFVRWFMARIISYFRVKKSQEIYKLIGGKSPILENTEFQKEYLKKLLPEFEFYISMRYSFPRSLDVCRAIQNQNIDEIILLPLYPQFSTTTTLSSIRDMNFYIKKFGLDKKCKVKNICCYYSNTSFVKSHIEEIKNILHRVENIQNTTIIFSAHNVPQKIIDDGDPYQKQIEKTVSLIMSDKTMQNINYIIAYQSKVGLMQWLKPNTKDVIIETCKNNTDIVIVPIAFVSEHSETLVELDIEYADLARSYGRKYYRVSALGASKHFMNSLADIIKSASNKADGCVCKCNFVENVYGW